MRTPNFIVRYLVGPAVPYDQLEYAGVFKVSSDVDDAFARSEPPTHDDWVPNILEQKHERTYIRVALRRIRESLDVFASQPERTSLGGAVPLGEFSATLGGLTPAELGTGATSGGGSGSGGTGGDGRGGGGGGSGGTGGGSGRRSNTRVDVLDEVRTEMVKGVIAAVVSFTLHRSRSEGVRVFANPVVVVDGGGIETEPPTGSDTPEVLEWYLPDGSVVDGSASLLVEGDDDGVWSVAVKVPDDAMISLSLRAVRAEPVNKSETPVVSSLKSIHE